MHLDELINRSSTPQAWAEGDNIPWNEPEFSRRMLQEHLSQAHDAASRRFDIIDRQAEWIHSTFLSTEPAKILDLGCGPGFYAERLARRGHTIHGIDYSPASIRYATETAQRDNLACTYTCQDIRQAGFPGGMGLVMLIFGEFNVFRPADAKLILTKAVEALKPGGWLLLEPHSYDMIQQIGERTASWYSSPGGLFSEKPHVVLREYFWNEQNHTTTIRYFVIDSDTSHITRFAQSFQAYHDDEYRALLMEHGFGEIQFLPGLSVKDPQKGLIVIQARKQG
jgi:SAM-dependent methyltransferase